MARGRMLNKSICLSLKFQQLPDDTCRLLATWIIPHLDKHGIFYADPTIVKSLVLPMRPDISVATVEQCLKTMESVGLIKTFTAEGRVWQCWEGFKHNQTNLRDDRETTEFPDPPDAEADESHPKGADAHQEAGVNARDNPAEIRQVSGENPAQSNLSEVNLIEIGESVDSQAGIKVITTTMQSEIAARTQAPPEDLPAIPSVATNTAHDLFFLPSNDATRRKIANLKCDENLKRTMQDFHELWPDVTYQVHQWREGAKTLWSSYQGDVALLRDASALARSVNKLPGYPGGIVWAVDQLKDKRRQKQQAQQSANVDYISDRDALGNIVERAVRR